MQPGHGFQAQGPNRQRGAGFARRETGAVLGLALRHLFLMYLMYCTASREQSHWVTFMQSCSEPVCSVDCRKSCVRFWATYFSTSQHA